MKATVARANTLMVCRNLESMCRLTQLHHPGPARFKRRIPAGALLFSLAMCSSGLAHHSYIRIDRNIVVAFEATVVDFDWRNPHVCFRVATETENGESVEWEIESGSTPILAHSGWSADSLNPGDVIRIRMHPEQNSDRRYALLESLTTVDGTVLKQGILPSSATETTADISGTWKSRLEPDAPIEVLSGLFAEFMTVPVTEAGQASIDGRSLTLDVFLEDPEFLAESFRGTLNWDYTPDFEFYRYDCDPDVATRFSLP